MILSREGDFDISCKRGIVWRNWVNRKVKFVKSYYLIKRRQLKDSLSGDFYGCHSLDL